MSTDVEEASSLFEKARQGSRGAINEVFERYGDRLHALIRLRLGPRLRQRLESRDVLQATLLKAFQGIDRFHGSGSRSMMAWLGAIAQAEICDQADFYGRKKRDRGRETTLDQKVEHIAGEVRSQTGRLQLQADSERLERALEALGDSHREVILLRSFEELSFPEVGERLSKSPDAARMLYARAMTALTLEMRKAPREA
jgi:RNA polymerase sigma-70 factor (ECF subfamily)